MVQAVVQPASDVSDEIWSFPWTSEALAPVSALYAGLHLLVFLGMASFAQSGYAGTGRSHRIGVGLAQIGTFLFLVAEFATIPFGDQSLDDPRPVVVAGVHGCGIALTAVGLIIVGVAALRSDRRRFVPLAAGLWSAVLIRISSPRRFQPASRSTG